jgi:hypothetical protein
MTTVNTTRTHKRQRKNEKLTNVRFGFLDQLPNETAGGLIRTLSAPEGTPVGEGTYCI